MRVDPACLRRVHYVIQQNSASDNRDPVGQLAERMIPRQAGRIVVPGGQFELDVIEAYIEVLVEQCVAGGNLPGCLAAAPQGAAVIKENRGPLVAIARILAESPAWRTSTNSSCGSRPSRSLSSAR